MPAISLDDVRAARDRIRDAIRHTPSPHSRSLSQLCGCTIYCKHDHTQVTGSFKERGARNRLMLLTDAERAQGVIAASAGNHALALAYHGGQLGIPVTVVMPRWAPMVKVANCRGLGANVVQHGDTFDEARQHAFALRDERQMTYVHGFDDAQIIAGAGTAALELLEDVPDLDAVIIPVGGGGLIAGMAVALRKLRPGVRIIGVEAENAPTFLASRRAGKVVRIEARPTLADGLAIAEIGKLCFEIANPLVDDIVLVDEEHLSMAVLRLLEMEKAVLEGAGAAALAAVLQHDLGLAGQRVALMLCGGNIDLTMISRVIERGLVADGRLCRFTCAISDRPGGLAGLTKLLATTGASVKEVFHDRSFTHGSLSEVAVTVLLETRDRAHVAEIERALIDAGVRLLRLSARS